MYLTKEYRLLSILIIIDMLLEKDALDGAETQAWFTSHDLAKRTWTTPQYCLKLLKELADDNLLHKCTIRRKNGVDVNLFTLSEQGTDKLIETSSLRDLIVLMTIASKVSDIGILTCQK